MRNTFYTNKLVLLSALPAVLAFAACSDDTVAPEPPPVNRPPQVTFTVAARAVPRSAPQAPRFVNLTVNATDPDGDAVTVLWEVTRDGQSSGVLNVAQQGQPTIRWQTPVDTGRDTITVNVSDGKDGGTTTLVETIQVGTLKEARVLAHETWQLIDSPYIIRPPSGDFVIDERSALAVAAGCELLIDKKDIGISVVGTLAVHGTADAPVAIRPNVRFAEPGHWKGITAIVSGAPPAIHMDHAQLWYATEAVAATNPAEVVLDGCRIALSKDAAVLHLSTGKIHVKNSLITSNLKSGIKIRRTAGQRPPTDVVISGNTITLNGDYTGEVTYTDQAGIYIALPDTLAEAAITISGNEIFENWLPGIQLVDASFPTINDNTIYGNELGRFGARYNIRLDAGFGVGAARDTIDATMNFWGGPQDPVTGEANIQEMVRDSADDGSVAVRVVVAPWRDARP